MAKMRLLHVSSDEEINRILSARFDMTRHDTDVFVRTYHLIKHD